MAYTIHKINERLIQVLDTHKDTIYLLLGSKQSIVFDLGMDLESIKPFLDSLIQTPYTILCSHGHFDHVGRSGEFKEIHMDKKDTDLYLANHSIHVETNLTYININDIVDIKEVYDLGDRFVYVVKCYGHTPGSVLLVDPLNKAVFTGDAIGSGCGVWMQVDYALSIKEYEQSLEEALLKLENLGVDESWSFYGGHARQEYYSKVSDYNPLCLSLMKDMKELCRLLLEERIDVVESEAREFSTGKPYYACFGKAEMIFTLSQLNQ